MYKYQRIQPDFDNLLPKALPESTEIPEYLSKTYWWAYVSPKAIKFFDRHFLVNLILFGNFKRLRDAAIRRLGEDFSGRVLQIASVYGNFTQRILDCMSVDGELDVVDVVPDQLSNLRRKVITQKRFNALVMDSSDLKFDSESYDKAILFFLLHEQPVEVRQKTLSEAWRVLRPGGRIVIVDYHKPSKLNPVRPLLWIVLKSLEPFALDLWRQPLESWLPKGMDGNCVHRRTFFGGIYQKMVFEKPGI